MSKYGAKKTMVDNIIFDSRREAIYYNELKVRKHAKEIIDFELQPQFTLLDKFRDNTGRMQRALTYTADFKIMHNDGSEEVVDVKGMVTQQYALRKKLFLHRYPEYKFTEVRA